MSRRLNLVVVFALLLTMLAVSRLPLARAQVGSAAMPDGSDENAAPAAKDEEAQDGSKEQATTANAAVVAPTTAAPATGQTTPKPAAPKPDESFELSLTSPAVVHGMAVRVSGRKIVIGPGDCQVNGKVINFATATKVIVPSPGQLKITDDQVRFILGDKEVSALVLPHCRAARGDITILHGVLVPGSVRVKAGAGEGGTVYKEGVDYQVDYNFGSIRRLSDGSIKPEDRLYVDYMCYRRRLDTIALDPQDGRLLLIQGIPARAAPEPPKVEPPVVALANVYSDWNEQPLRPSDILPISVVAPQVGAAKQQVHNLKALAPVLKKLEAGEPVHIVFWGDGVSVGFDARTKDDGFAYAFVKALRNRYPKSNIMASNLGIPSSDSSTRVDHLDAEVLALKPDVIVVEFVDDMALPTTMLEDIYEKFLDKVKKTGTRVVFCTPHFPAPKLAHAADWANVEDKAYIAVLRELAQNNDYVALADVSYRWQNLDKEGLRPDLLLVNGLSNLNSKGHSIYVEELLRCFGITDASS